MARWVLPTPGGPRKTTFSALDETERRQALDLLPLQRGLKAEVEVGERLHRRETAAPHRCLQSAVVAQCDLRSEYGGDRLSGAQTAVDAGEHSIQPLEGAWHLQIGELGADLVSETLHSAPAAIAA